MTAWCGHANGKTNVFAFYSRVVKYSKVDEMPTNESYIVIILLELFCGQIMSTLTCTKCNHRSVTFDPFWDLSLSIPRVCISCRYYSRPAKF